MANKIKAIIDNQGKNPHIVSQESGITYRIVLGLYNADEIKPTTSIGTLDRLAKSLGVKVDDLYDNVVEPA